MLLSEAFPRNPYPVRQLKNKLGITTVEQAKALSDEELHVRGVGKKFISKVRNFQIPEEYAVKSRVNKTGIVNVATTIFIEWEERSSELTPLEKTEAKKLLIKLLS